MTIQRALLFSILMSAAAISGPALAQNCTRQLLAMTAGGACCRATPSSLPTAHDRT
jgi:hypothetical protein